MQKQQVLDHFGGVGAVRQAIAGQGDTISRQAIYDWSDIIPIERAFQLEKASNGDLVVDVDLYRKKSA